MRYSAIIRGRIVGQIVAQYLTQPQVEYLFILKKLANIQYSTDI